jgi:uncharacterized membrane protein YoaK (UPF0700 family)
MASSPSPPIPAAVPTVLGFVAGYVDGCTFLALFGLFVAQVTGSFVLAGAELVAHDPGVVVKIAAIPVFLGAGVLTTLVVHAVRRRGDPLPWALAMELVFLAGLMGAGLVGRPLHDPGAPAAVTAALCGLAAMGVQSAYVRLMFAGYGSTNVMTTATTQLAIDLAEAALAWRHRRRDAHGTREFVSARRRLLRGAPVVAAFLAGTGTGALAYVMVDMWALAAVLALMLAVIVWAIIRKE